MARMDQAIRLGKLRVANRLVKSATAENAATEVGDPDAAYLRFYSRLAAGGAGLIVTGHIFVDREGRANTRSPLLDSDERVAAFREVTRCVHEHGGTVFAQLNHAGREAEPIDGRHPPAPSKRRNSLTRSLPRAMTVAEIKKVIERLAASAARARDAGFDGVQLHGAHGYLIGQFLSPRTNRRTDEWGGAALGQRARFFIEVYRACRSAAGADFPIIAKISGSDHLRGGQTLEDSIEVARLLDAEGLDGIEVSGGAIESGFFVTRGDVPIREILEGRGLLVRTLGGLTLRRMARKVRLVGPYNLDEACAVKGAVRMPVIAVGGFRSRDQIADALGSWSVDMVAMARPLIREPGLPKRLLAGTAERTSCVSCNLCLAGRASASEPRRCRNSIRAPAARPEGAHA